jgi:hypothetical protein
VLGLQKVECLDNYLDYVPPGDLPAALAAGTEFEAPIYVYRGRVSSANVMGVIHPYKGDLNAISNYGFSGGSAHLDKGPELEEQAIKAFFYEGPDGLTFYMIQNKAGGSFENTARILMSVKNNSTGAEIVLSDEDGDIIPLPSPSTKRLLDLPVDATLFDGEFIYDSETAGGIIGRFDDLTEVRPWEVILDPLDTGNLIIIKAADGKDDSEFVLAQGPVKVNFDLSTLRLPLGDEDLDDDAPPNEVAWGNLVGVSTGNIQPGESGENTWWYRFVGDPSGPEGPKPYSLFDGTYGNRAPDIGTGLLFAIFSALKDQNIRLWRDFTPGEIGFVEAVDGTEGGPWPVPFQRPDMRIYSINADARNKFTDQERPITITDLRVLCTCYEANSTAFTLTVIDEDGNAFEFPEKTVQRRLDDPNALTWISFGPPTANEVVVVESDPSTLESPPTGTIVGTRVTGKFRATLDLRKVQRLIVDVNHVEEGQYVLAIHTIAAMLEGMGRWPEGHARAKNEPQAYAILDAMAVYWRYTEPDDGYPEIPDNVIANYLLQWWPPQAVLDRWSIIPGYEGESIKSSAGAGISTIAKDPMEEIRNNRIIFTPIPPTDGCQMFWKQVEWLERGHRIGAACSFYVVIDGMGFIVTKRSVGVDETCGGGESASNPCVFTFTGAGEGHPAIAWPSVNGEEFVGLPNSGFVTFIKDDDLSERILEKLNAGNVTNINGDPVNNIPFILFPSI